MTPEVAGYIEKIAIEPIKSGGILELKKAILTPAGMETVDGLKDHLFMVVYATPNVEGVHLFATQRDAGPEKPQGMSKMAKITPQYEAGNLQLTWGSDERDPIDMPLDYNMGKVLRAQIHKEPIPYQVIDQGDGIAQWATDHLGVDVRVVKAAGPFQRVTRQNYVPNVNPLRFQDGYPVHWFYRESLDEYNQVARAVSEESKGKIPCTELVWQSLRPQGMLKGMPAQFEHLIAKGSVGGVLFEHPTPCGRCKMPRVNQETGEVNALDPLVILARYKAWNDGQGTNKLIFGENVNPLGVGEIALGDPVIVCEFRNPPLIYGPIKRSEKIS